MVMPLERRALGLAMRQAERERLIEAPSTVRELVSALPYAPMEIDRCLALLVDSDGRTIGGTLDPNELDEMWAHDLWRADMIERDGGRWVLSKKGRAMSRLLDEYGNPKHRWRSLIADPRQSREPMGRRGEA